MKKSENLFFSYLTGDLKMRLRYLNVPWTPMDSDGTCGNSQVSASKKWLTLAALTCNWQLKLANFRKFNRCPLASMGH